MMLALHLLSMDDRNVLEELKTNIGMNLHAHSCDALFCSTTVLWDGTRP